MSAHAELLFDQNSSPESASQATAAPNVVNADGTISAGAPADTSADDVLFDKPEARPVHSNDLHCGPSGHPKSWDRALGWAPRAQTLPEWGWSRERWCGDLNGVMDKLSSPVTLLGRWASCDGAVAMGDVLSTSMATLCAARYNRADWVELRPSMVVYSVGTWNEQGQSCPSVVIEVQQIVGALGGSQTHVLVPLEGSCTAWHGLNPLEKGWSTVPPSPALIQEGQQRWAGYDGTVPDGWRVGWFNVGQASSNVPASSPAPSIPLPVLLSVPTSLSLPVDAHVGGGSTGVTIPTTNPVPVSPS